MACDPLFSAEDAQLYQQTPPRACRIDRWFDGSWHVLAISLSHAACMYASGLLCRSASCASPHIESQHASGVSHCVVEPGSDPARLGAWECE